MTPTYVGGQAQIMNMNRERAGYQMTYIFVCVLACKMFL